MKHNLKKQTALLVSGLAVCAVSAPVQASAKFDITVSIDQKDVSLTKLEDNDYEVPIFVRLAQNVNLNAVEFGIDVDSRCRFSIVTRSSYADLYGESISMDMSSAIIPASDSYAWLTWASTSVYYYENSNILLLLVKIPENAQAGDVYTIRYLTESPSDASKTHVWYNYGTNTNYAESGSVLWNDGKIAITPAEDTPQPTTEPEPEYLLGDANLDGSVDILDAITVNKAILGKEELSALQVKAADLNGNGVPDSADSLMIMKKIVGLI
ncbi:MAG: dockerin type I repeat-containing protein [Oscillospiraceae bacterium]|nr:dockerin type I repeat-containing protein [Oscillospiraceae bacterium]